MKFRDMIMGTLCFGSLAKERVEGSTVSSNNTVAQCQKIHEARRNYKIMNMPNVPKQDIAV